MQKQKLDWFVGYLALQRIDKYMQKAHFNFSQSQI